LFKDSTELVDPISFLLSPYVVVETVVVVDVAVVVKEQSISLGLYV